MISPSSVLQVRGVQAGYGAITVLWDVSWTWPADRHIFHLAGANGSGRTTLMRVVSGLLKPTAGGIWMFGQDVTTASPQQRYEMGMTLVPEGRELFTGMTVEENLRAGLRRTRDWPQIRDDVLGTFPPLAALMSRRVESLSGGQQQMVAVGRGMASRPKVLLLDEPYAGLAPQIVEDIETAVEGLAGHGMHVMVVEEMRTAAQSTEGLELSRGRVVVKEDLS